MDDYIQAFLDLEKEFNAIIVLNAAENLIPEGESARLAAQSHGGMSKITVLDSKQIGTGIGIIAQHAARKIATGASMPEVELYIRSLIPYLFTMICPEFLPGSPNPKNHTPAESIETSTSSQIYSLENGSLSPYKKIRSQRHLLDNFQEFIGEFEYPQILTYFHGPKSTLHVRPLREFAGALFPKVHFTNMEINRQVSNLFGETLVGITILEAPADRVLGST